MDMSWFPLDKMSCLPAIIVIAIWLSVVGLALEDAVQSNPLHRRAIFCIVRTGMRGGRWRKIFRITMAYTRKEEELLSITAYIENLLHKQYLGSSLQNKVSNW